MEKMEKRAGNRAAECGRGDSRSQALSLPCGERLWGRGWGRRASVEAGSLLGGHGGEECLRVGDCRVVKEGLEEVGLRTGGWRSL